jgi:hypothetical protein
VKETHIQTVVPAATPALWPWMLGQLVLAMFLAWWNRGVLNHDAIAYIRIAEYYARWDVALMSSGYWGPLFSWVMALGLVAGATGELAARMAMLLSAMVFLAGSACLIRRLGVDARIWGLSMALMACSGAVWSAQNITPDLLMAGLAVWAIALGSPANAGDTPRRPVLAGLLWGLAYLAKPVALPWMLLVAVAQGLLEARTHPSCWRKSAITVGTAMLIALPWIFVISAKYNRITISTSGPIAHAIAGPLDVDRYHPTFVTLHRPGKGRITSWEDPTTTGLSVCHAQRHESRVTPANDSCSPKRKLTL